MRAACALKLRTILAEVRMQSRTRMAADSERCADAADARHPRSRRPGDRLAPLVAATMARYLAESAAEIERQVDDYHREVASDRCV